MYQCNVKDQSKVTKIYRQYRHAPRLGCEETDRPVVVVLELGHKAKDMDIRS